jgi:eukaryotic-like serine/threonine-protein kinase
MSDLKAVLNNEEVDTTSNDFDADMTRIMDPIVVNEKRNSNDEFDDPIMGSPDGKKGLDNKKKRMILFAAIAVLVIAIGAVAGFFAYSKLLGGAGSSTDVTVPTIVGLSQDDAKKAVEGLNLKFTVAEKITSDKPVGTVVQCNPDQGTKVKVNSEVRVYISAGNSSSTIPNLVNMDISSAKDVITNSGFIVGDITYAYSDTIPTDSVISQTPPPDSTGDSNTKVNLVVSKGAEVKNVAVPDLSGKTYDQASALLLNAKLKIAKGSDIAGTQSSTAGTVALQNPSAGISVQEGSTVTIQLYGTYTAPTQTMVTIPNIIDMTQAQASTELQSVGLVFGTPTISSSDTPKDKTSGTICSQQTGSVAKGSTVSVVVYK